SQAYRVGAAFIDCNGKEVMTLRKTTFVLALAAAAWLTPQRAQAWERLQHWCNQVHVWSAQAHAWYDNVVESCHTPCFMYFPAGQCAPSVPFASHSFPTWPSNFPPPQNGPAWQFSMPSAPAYAPAYQPTFTGPGMGYPSSAFGRPTGQTSGW